MTAIGSCYWDLHARMIVTFLQRFHRPLLHPVRHRKAAAAEIYSIEPTTLLNQPYMANSFGTLVYVPCVISALRGTQTIRCRPIEWFQSNLNAPLDVYCGLIELKLKWNFTNFTEQKVMLQNDAWN